MSRSYRKGQREILAVRDLDLEIRPGEWLAVRGKTGHGKTTLLQLLGGLDRPTRGRIEFGGTDLASAAEATVRKLRSSSFGFIFQTFNLIPTLSAGERRGGADSARGAAGSGAPGWPPRWTAWGSATARSTCPGSCPGARSWL